MGNDTLPVVEQASDISIVVAGGDLNRAAGVFADLGVPGLPGHIKPLPVQVMLTIEKISCTYRLTRVQTAAEVKDVDLRVPLTDETRAAIPGVSDTSVLVFREQDLDKAQQVAFTEQFGVLERHANRNKGTDDFPRCTLSLTWMSRVIRGREVTELAHRQIVPAGAFDGLLLRQTDATKRR